MVSRQLKGRITEDGKLEVEIPPEFTPGEITITLEQQRNDFWTEEELEEIKQSVMNAKARPAHEIEIPDSGWPDMGITDSQAFVDSLRRDEEERRDRRDD
jgi:hypothetical protein